MSALLQNAGLPPGLLDQTRILVTTEELFGLWRGIGQASTNPAIGLELGTETKREHFDPIALAALSTASFGEAMRQMASYKQLSCPEEIIHQTDGDEWSIHFRWLLANDAEPEVLTDLCFAWVLCIARHGTGTRISPLRVELVRPRAYAKTLERHFGCPIAFGAARNAIVFRSSDVDLPFVTRNAELLSMLAPQLDEELKHHKGQETFPERVRAIIQRKLAGQRPRMQDIARELHISSRTLQRHLQDEGYSFQQVLEQARHQLARHYLNNSLLELNETAYLLGYEDANSFVRAFRSWEGVPPAHWREAQREKVMV
ncbi:AraC-like DNA-binding protein [Silvibacterium bohemicum]|uniref:AraC-like DNA-binding protein n=1 Tax=Silvibacterium bohemicum TaxID=1577686 RepID=A0A841JQ26_9BACT|nr:AraC family transcriptional regulator [Silvibacterium bohemicum]MBB6142667.1 AraC-like DNA-binding protein [Silvibacterium bohemicum]